jgi:hypothetical protein
VRRWRRDQNKILTMPASCPVAVASLCTRVGKWQGAGVAAPWSMAERRKHLRTNFVEDCSWQRAARVTDLSLHGCYVDSYRVPAIGEMVEFTVTLWGQEVSLRGICVHATPGLGFAIEFASMDEAASSCIASYVLRSAATRTTH